jgi:hypothetical protein
MTPGESTGGHGFGFGAAVLIAIPLGRRYIEERWVTARQR